MKKRHEKEPYLEFYLRVDLHLPPCLHLLLPSKARFWWKSLSLGCTSRAFRRAISARRYVYIWADGVYFTPRMDSDRQCMLVVIGVDEHGEKDVLAIEDRFRENADSW